MIKLIRRNQRVFLAGLTILSMLVFVVQRGTGGGGNDTDRVYGSINGTKVYTSELVQTRAELQALQHSLYLTNNPYARPESILTHYLGDLGSEMQSKPEWFLLLRREADAANIQINKDDIASELVNLTRDGAGNAWDQDSDAYIAARAGLTDVKKIMLRFNQVEGAIKISKPMADQSLVQESESLSLSMVQLNASDYLSKTAAPTTQQVQDQFKAFANDLPQHPMPTTNPFGFGYKLPMRSKLQYIRVSPESLGAAVEATKSSYDWEVAARKYYLNNPQEFTKPATTQPATPGLPPVPSTQPDIQLTFDQAREQVLKAIRMPTRKALLEQVRDYLTTTMNADYQAYLQFCTANKGGQAPDSSVGVPYASPSYLTKLTDAVKSRFNVVIVENETSTDLSTQQIGNLPGIGNSNLAAFVDKQAIAYLALLDKDSKDPTAPAILMKPSGPIQGPDEQADAYGIVFARLSEVLRSQPPADIKDAQSQVVADVKMSEAYTLAQKDADSVQAIAQKSSMAIAAITVKKTPILLQGNDAVSYSSNDIKSLYPPLGDSAISFTKQAFEMTARFDPKTNPHPVQIIALPEQQRLFVAQLIEVNADWDSERYYEQALRAQLLAAREFRQLITAEWFNYEAVVKRVGFKPNK